ncbi:MAG: hypothetical protein WDN47_04665 [Candidatus Doudnabacteria bacterium]
MIHNVFFIIIVTAALMFLDFYLTIKGARLYTQGYSEHIKADNYEMNPMFQKNVAEFKYNFRHLLYVVLVSLLIYLFYYLSQKNIIYNSQSFAIIPGLLFTTMVYINANHLRNIVIFKALKKNPNMLKGQIEQTYLYSLKTAQAQLLVLLLPLLVILIMSPSYFVLGGVIALIGSYFTHRRWKKKATV